MRRRRGEGLGEGVAVYVLLCLLLPITTVAQVNPSPSQVTPTTSPEILMPFSNSASVTETPPPMVGFSSGSGSGSGLFLCDYVGDISYSFALAPQDSLSDLVSFPIGAYYDTSTESYYTVRQQDVSLDAECNPAQQCLVGWDYSNNTFRLDNVELTPNLDLEDYCCFTLIIESPESAPSYCPTVEIDVIITFIAPTSPVCTNNSSYMEGSLYDSISSSLEVFDCFIPDSTAPVIYIVDMDDDEFSVNGTEFSPVFADYFDPGTYEIVVSVCRSNRPNICSNSSLNVMLTVNEHSGRLFPFGANYEHSSLDYADDRAVPVIVSNRIPFWSQYHRVVYLSTNGLASFGFPFTSWYPIPFPYGRTLIPIIAPYWNDLDFRNSVPESALYYNIYETDSMRGQAVITEFSDRLSNYSAKEVSFTPEWLLISTWNKATPYYGRYSQDETLTFQLVLATDYVRTFAFFLYEEDGINWNSYRQTRRIVIGYDAKDFQNYNSVDFTASDYLNIDDIIGNTGHKGQWYFDLTEESSETDNAEQLCLTWANSQPDDILSNFDDISSCPGTRRQARRDWRFFFGFRWGLSTRPECATLFFPRTRSRSSVECCYDDAGSLIVGPKDGGSYKLYNSLFSPTEYYLQDLLPYEQCCRLSDRCTTYYKYRPSDDGSGYIPPRPIFMWGDPHFQSVDGVDFTFNGIGEYVLLTAPVNNLEVQVRFVPFDDATMATVTTGVAIQYMNSLPIEILINRTTRELQLYTGGSLQPTPDSESIVMVTQDNTYNDIAAFLESGSNPSDPSVITIINDGEQLIVTTGSGTASIMVTPQNSFLRTTLELSEDFIDDTRGLLGVYNGDPNDDFTLPDGNSISIDLTESVVYYMFGLAWHVNATENSLFSYSNGNDYAFYNDGFDGYEPTFSDAVTDDPPPECEDDRSCIYDFFVSNNIELGMSTLEASLDNRDTETVLENRPPNISGPLILFVTAGIAFSVNYTVEDIDNHTVDHFTLMVSNSTDLVLNALEIDYSYTLHWPVPSFDLPSSSIQLFSNDTLGASTTHILHIVLCGCSNGGECVETTDDEQLFFNDYGHYKLPCLCTENFTGDSCEIDTRGCDLNPCPDYSICMVNNSVPEGYTCTMCEEGYFLDAEDKCTDVDECNTTDPDQQNNCDQLCINTDGSFECECTPGYRLSDDGSTCTDINECAEGLDDCDHFCNNNNGSFSCECLDGFVLGADGVCTPGTCNNNSVCNGLGCAQDGDTVSCYCSAGERCTSNGACTGSLSAIVAADQQCSACPDGYYGFECSRSCLPCVNGRCDANAGCVCDPRWEGFDCSTEINLFSPVFDPATPSSLDLPWDVPALSPIVAISATDDDDFNSVSYNIVSPSFGLPDGVSDGVGVFEIDRGTGLVRLIVDLNTTRGVYSSFVLTIEARDNGALPRTTQHILLVLPIAVALPIPEFSQSLYEIDIDESLINETFITITCFETSPAGDPNKLVTILLPGNGSEFFALENGSSVAVIKDLDYEILDPDYPVYSIMLQCTNQYNLSTTTEIQIEIKNIDDNPLTFENSTYYVTVSEDTQRDTEIYTVTAFDADEPNKNIIYSLLDSSRDFDIDQNSGGVYVLNGLDRERISRYNLTLEASDTAVTVTATIIIELSDVNDKRPIFDRGVYAMTELSTQNETGDIVVVVNATDGDIGSNAEITYALEINDYFIINSTTGVVAIGSSSIPFGRYKLTVYAIDNGHPSLNGTATLDIVIQPSVERIQFEFEHPAFLIPEDLPRGSTIGYVSANLTEDPSDFISGVQYRIVDGTVTTLFHLGSSSGEIILLDALDYEAVQYHLLEVEAFIPDEPLLSPAETIITITLTDVNDNAPVFIPSFYAATVEEFTEIGSSILKVKAQDEDELMNGEVRYRLEDSTNIPFGINSTTGVLYIKDSLDTPQDYRFNVIAEDRGDPMLSSEAVVFLAVIRPVSLTVQFTKGIYIFNVSESTMIGTAIGSVTAINDGSNPILNHTHLEYHIRFPDVSDFDGGSGSGSGDGPSLFEIDEMTGEVYSLTMFDRESQDTYVFHVEVLDTNTNMVVADASVRVTIVDVNDNSPVFLQSLYTVVISESALPQTTIVEVEASDEDDGENSQIEYRLESGVLGFDIEPSSGNVFVVNDTLRAGEYSFMVLATDSQEPVQMESVNIIITVIPSAPEEIFFSQSEYNFNVAENSMIGQGIGMIEVVDSNSQPVTTNIEYSLIHPILSDTPLCLHINPQTGMITSVCRLDREQQSHYEVVVIANYTGDLDNGRPRYGVVKVVVDVTDENDNPPVFTRVVYADVILDTHGTATPILTVEARDRDVGENAEVFYELVEVTEGDLTPTYPNTDLFVLNDTSGEIYLASTDVPPGDYKLTVRAKDRGTPQMESLIPATVLISVIRALPSGLIFGNTSFSIRENQTGLVERVVLMNRGIAVDPADYPNNLRFLLLGGTLFTVDSESGDIYTNGTLDREMEASHVFVVRAVFEDFDITVEAHVTITVTDVNDNSPFFSQLVYSAEIDTSYEVGAIVPTFVAISADDIDEGTNSDIIYSIESGTPFEINSTTGEIFIKDTSLFDTFDFSLEYNISIFASDMGNPPLTGEAEVFIIVTHALPAFISFPPLPFVFNHTEESAAGIQVGVVAVEQNVPALVYLDYDIIGPRDFFSVDFTSGNITNTRTIDRETHQQLNFTVMAFFPGENISSTADVIVNLVDINDNHPTFDPDIYRVTILTNELSTTVALVNLSAMDRDVGVNGELDFQILTVNNDTTSLFTVSENGMIFVTTNEVTPGIYQLEISAQDRGDPVLSGTAFVFITIELGVPNTIAFTEETYQFNTSEYTPSGSLIGRVELERLAEEFQQYLTFNTTSMDFIISSVTGDIRSNIDFDFEDKKFYVFTVEATLNIPPQDFSLSTVSTVNVTIVDENDNYPEFVDFPSLLQVNENRTQETFVGNIIATDRDSGSNSLLSFAILNDVNGFSIDSISGELTVAASLDREEQEYYTLIIGVTDSGSPQLSSNATLTVQLNDINDNPPNLESGVTYEVPERVPAGTEVFQFNGSDLDSGVLGTIRYVFLTGSAGFFTLGELTGIVTLQRELDYEENPSFDLELRLRDNWEQDRNHRVYRRDYDITINVINRPDTVPVFNQPFYELTTSPRVSNGEVFVSVAATDGDGDSLVYSIASITHDGNNNEMPEYDINPETGEIFSSAVQEFVPEAVFTVTVEATDNSIWALSVSVEVRIEVLPEALEFTQQAFSYSVREDASVSSTIGELTISPLSRSSDIEYTIEVSPSGNDNKFRADSIASGGVVLLNGQLDRETIDSYSIVVTATRSGDFTTTTLDVAVLDVNDNRPVFSASNTLIEIEENVGSQTSVTVVSATDDDTGSNAEIEYFLNPSTIPFMIDLNTGTIRVSGEIDYEQDDSFTLMVQARDKGSPALSSTITYTINVINLNDNNPQFSAPAYFGELYSKAPLGSLVHHVILSVTDDDDDSSNQQAFSFTISPQNGYDLRVSDSAPYYIEVVSIPDNEASEIVTFTIEVTDEGGTGRSSSANLYVSIFTSEHLIPLTLRNIDKEEFLSCQNNEQSVCELESQMMAKLRERIDSSGIIMVNADTIETEDNGQLHVTLYSWHGDAGVIGINGELAEAKAPSVEYIVVEENRQSIQQAVTAVDDSGVFEFEVEIDLPTESSPTTETPDGGFMIIIVVGIVVGGGIGALVIVLIIVVVIVFGRRRRQIQDRDPYDRPLTPHTKLRSKPRKPARSRCRLMSEETALTSAGASDLAYETMYDDEDVMGPQTMPWFDPKYIAEEGQEEEYHADSEATSTRTDLSPLPLQVVGSMDTRRSKRLSSDESAGSMQDLDHTEYLKGYQESVPMKPGQQMGEFDMFARPSGDPDKPFRPALQDLQWDQPQKTSSM